VTLTEGVVQRDDENLQGMIGRHPRMLDVYRLVRRYAPRKLSIAIVGETGTGKELVARAIHDLSDARRGRFVDINCAALPESLAEGELFGWERGAFTGAVGSAIGLIETAHLGTLFLDEACSLSLGLQAKLLRVIEQQEFRRLGGRDVRRSSFRVIAAMSEPLDHLVRTGRLRPDFVYRVSAVTVPIPPLRARREDLAELAQHFLSAANENGHPNKTIGEGIPELLQRHRWPGNVRELKALMERVEVEIDGDIVSPADLALQLHLITEQQDLPHALTVNNWDVTQTARYLGIARSTVYEQMKKLNLQRPFGPSRPVPDSPGVGSDNEQPFHTI
jgi:transcriptional regulator with PAS, ATPase and Fis domain